MKMLPTKISEFIKRSEENIPNKKMSLYLKNWKIRENYQAAITTFTGSD